MNCLFLGIGVLVSLIVSLWIESAQASTSMENSLSGVNIQCNSNNILVTISTKDDFNGMVYPKGLSKNSSCLTKYEHAGSKILYALPLRSCNTMSHDVDQGIEYFNTLVVQPHHKLVTNYGKGFRIRCRYETSNKTIKSNVGINDVAATPIGQFAQMPACTMKIYIGSPDNHVVAEQVKIGDYLTLVISIEEQAVYGIKVTNCIVKDGLNWSEQPLINNDGCPIDEEIMGPFEYKKNMTSALVTYPAHKFPFTSSVYYQCNVKLCLKQGTSCEDAPPVCDQNSNNVRRRRKRQANNEIKDRADLIEIKRHEEDAKDRSIEVFSGLYVNEVDEADDDGNPISLKSRSEEDFCVSTKKFAIGIAIAGILLMLAVIFLVACIVYRRRRRKTTSTAGSSIYSGPYSNHAYSRD